ncbi:MAG: histidinol dehydrogenase, partial [Woeseiaceae bacterium]
MSLNTINWSELNVDERQSLLQRPALRAAAAVDSAVTEIIEQVRSSGDAALTELTRQFDGIDIDGIQVSDEEFDRAERDLSPAAIEAIQVAIGNVKRFHEAQLPLSLDIQPMPGIRCERLARPIDAVGLYVPAGSAPLPSTAIMLAVPAAIAACPQRILCTPPRPDGRADPAVLTAARRSGVDSVFKVGGAQAIAAMAYGTELVPKVNKIFGPGNVWVTAAKTLVAGDPLGAAIDMPAGPSEVLVIADETANAEFVAADLLSQAEHGEDSQVILVTTDRQLARHVGRQIDVPVHHEDPAGTTAVEVASNALAEAQRQGAYWLLLDTGGRLHIDDELMAELETLKAAVNPAETLLVVDAL